jgi:septal ring factor EnvC (AmiA/AmiB activator)
VTEVKDIKTDLKDIKTDLKDIKTDPKDTKTDLKDITTEVKNMVYAFQTIQKEMALQTRQRQDVIESVSRVISGLSQGLVLGVVVLSILWFVSIIISLFLM